MNGAYVVYFEVCCWDCGREAGELTINQKLDPHRRCEVCFGLLHFSGESRRELRPLSDDISFLVPKRGRPTRKMLEQRRRAASEVAVEDL